MDVKVRVDLENQLLKFFSMMSVTNFDRDGNIVSTGTPMELGVCSFAHFNTEVDAKTRFVHSEMIPNAVRYLNRNPYTGTYVIILEQKPMYHKMQYTGQYLGDFGNNVNMPSAWTFDIPMPYVQYFVKLSRSHIIEEISIYCSSTPLQTPIESGHTNNVSYPAPIHNLYDGGILCRPTFQDGAIQPDYTSIMSVLNQVETEVWGSGSNEDLFVTVSKYYDYWCGNYEEEDEDTCCCEKEDCSYCNGKIPEETGRLTLFDIINNNLMKDKRDPIYWSSEVDSGWSNFSRKFYANWQKIPMKDILSVKQWGHGDDATDIIRRAESHCMSYAPGMAGRTNQVTDFSTLSTADLLACAQNAIMQYQIDNPDKAPPLPPLKPKKRMKPVFYTTAV